MRRSVIGEFKEVLRNKEVEKKFFFCEWVSVQNKKYSLPLKKLGKMERILRETEMS